MKVGFIGAGKVGCSLGKYLVTHGVNVVGYLSKRHSSAEQVAHFTGTRAFDSLEQVVQASDILFITTPDHEISLVWEELRKLPLAKKCICHCSGSLSSAVFHGRDNAGLMATRFIRFWLSVTRNIPMKRWLMLFLP